MMSDWRDKDDQDLTATDIAEMRRAALAKPIPARIVEVQREVVEQRNAAQAEVRRLRLMVDAAVDLLVRTQRAIGKEEPEPRNTATVDSTGVRVGELRQLFDGAPDDYRVLVAAEGMAEYTVAITVGLVSHDARAVVLS